MLDSGRHDTRLVGMLHTPWDISVVTCNIDQGDTNSAHHCCLPRVSREHHGIVFNGQGAYPQQPISRGTQLHAPEFGNCCFVDDEASLTAVTPLRGLDHGLILAHMQLWHCRTTVNQYSSSLFRMQKTYIFLLLMNMSNLKPDVFLCQWRRRGVHDVLETLEIVKPVVKETLTWNTYL